MYFVKNVNIICTVETFDSHYEYAKNKILEIEEEYKNYPLVFSDGSSEVKNINTDADDISTLLEKILTFTHKYFSTLVDDKSISCFPNKCRSSFDIWRHALYIDKNISLLSVVETLGNFDKKTLVGHYCSDIGRRVFKLKKFAYDGNYSLLFFGQSDEYHLQYNDWRFINTKLEDIPAENIVPDGLFYERVRVLN